MERAIPPRGPSARSSKSWNFGRAWDLHVSILGGFIYLPPTRSFGEASGTMFFLVTGASGVGKTSVRKLVEAEIAGQVAVCELGTLGITPEWSLRWRHQAVEHVVQLALRN